MYPDWQFLYWFRSVFWKKNDFVYRDERTGQEVRPGAKRRALLSLMTVSALAGSLYLGPERIAEELRNRAATLDVRTWLKSLTS